MLQIRVRNITISVLNCRKMIGFGKRKIGYDNLTRTYERDYSGLVTKINRPGGRYTRYCYDKLGRVIRADYYDKTYENFTYNKNGALIEAENQYGKRNAQWAEGKLKIK